MSKIDDLIKELCLEGVKVKELGDIAVVKTGQAINKTMIQNSPGDYPVVNSGKDPLGYYKNYNTEDDPIGITSRGAGVGSVTWYEGRYFRGNLNYSVTIKEKREIMNRYLFHLLLNNQNSIQALATYDGIPALNASNLKKLSVSVPPLEIQKEIVRVLDSFTELEAELEARKKQYEYYRNTLLTFEDDVVWKPMGEIGSFYGGLTGKSKNDFSDGNAKFITFTNIFSNIAVKLDTDATVKISQNEKQNTVMRGDVLFTGSSEIKEESGMSSVVTMTPVEPMYLNSFSFGFRIKNEFKDDLNPEFMKFLFRSNDMRKSIIKTANGVTRFNISKKRMLDVKVPIIPLVEQNRIVVTLDKFEKLTNDISIGLPAEIEARRKQYEYYRNKLLTFKELECSK